MYVLQIYACIYTACIQTLKAPEEGRRSSETIIIDICELLDKN